MDLVGKIVTHNKYGEGIIVRQNKTSNGITIYIYFEHGYKDEIGFQLPQAFIGNKVWLSTQDEELLTFIKEANLLKEATKIENRKDESKKIVDAVTVINQHNAKINTNRAELHKFYDKTAKILRVPKEIKYIGRGCFFGLNNIEEIILEGIKEIGPEAFYGCKNLKKIIFPKSLLRIASRAFESCTKLSRIVIPSYCSYIGEGAFNFNDKLKEINCEAKKMPTFWDRKWNKNKKCQISWGFHIVPEGEALIPVANIELEQDGNKSRNFTYICNKRNILYVYKGNITCNKNKHNVISATAIVHNKYDKEIELNVDYCIDCNRLLLNYNLYKLYNERFHGLIGNFRLIENDNFEGEIDWAKEGPLRLSNYTVNKTDNLKDSERCYILARLIYDGSIEKHKVIQYLSQFIQLHESKIGDELAVSKWKEDLNFVQRYNMTMQPKFAVKEINGYK